MKIDDLPCCGQCGYELTGLPDESQCPECGNRFNKLTGSGLRGDPHPDKRSSVILRHLRTIAMVIAAGFIITCTGVMTMLPGTDTRRVLYSGLFITFVVLLGALTSYPYEKNPE